jgi:PleD family two-component response regulator
VARRERGESQESLIARADKAMYQAKLQGKNRVIAAEQ